MSNLNDNVNDIVNDINDDSKSLSNTLRKALVFFYDDIKNEEITTWVKKELQGYSNDNIIPEYRIINKVLLRGNFFNGSRYTKQQIHFSVIESLIKDEKIIRNLKILKVKYPIKEIEVLAKSKNDFKVFLLPPEFAHSLSKKVYREMDCFVAWREVGTLYFESILDNIKTKFLELLLELKKLYPDINIELLKKESNKVSDKNIIINTHGQSSTIQLNLNSDNPSMNNNTNDIYKLIEAVKQFNLPKEAIEELKIIEPCKPNFKERVLEWAKNLPLKLGDKMIDSVPYDALMQIILNFFK
jgi:hypothetical protein